MGEHNPLLKDNASPDASITGVAVRFGVYSVLLAAALASLPWWVERLDTEIFREDNLVENTQVAIVGLLAVAFAAAAFFQRDRRAVYGVMSHLFALAAVRELDSALNRLIGGMGWKLPALILCVSLALYIVWRRKSLAPQIRWLINKRSFAIIWAGFIFVVVCAQLIGHGRLMQSLMGDQYETVTYYKRIVEEFIELVGYYILFVGSLELFIEDLWKRARRDKPTDKDKKSGFAPDGDIS